MKATVCYIISELDQSIFIDATEKFLDGDKYEKVFIFLTPVPPKLYESLGEKGYRVEFVKFTSRKELPLAVFRLRKLLADIRPDIVHTHMVSASLAGLTAAYLSGIKRRVHTRHHSTECHVYYPHGVYYDKFISRLSNRIVAISQSVEEILTEREGVDGKKIHLIRHGLDLANIKADQNAVQAVEREYDLAGKYPVIGVISRFVHWKGVQHIIPAFKKLTLDYPQAKLVLANAEGNYTEQITALLEANLEPAQYSLILFESRIFELYATFDVFVHVPINRDLEAFGLVYIEPLMLNIPSVFTLSGIAPEFIEDRKNAMVVPYEDAEAIYRAMKELLENKSLRESIVKKGKEDVSALFSGEKMADEMDYLYSSLLSD